MATTNNRDNSVTKRGVILVASSLIGGLDDQIDPEYGRAISELTCDLIGLSTEYKEAVEYILRAMHD